MAWDGVSLMAWDGVSLIATAIVLVLVLVLVMFRERVHSKGYSYLEGGTRG